ncbi:hypothetical protein Tco_0073748 [Tanacetum coccineum]
MACLATITSRSSSLFKSKRNGIDSIIQFINALVETRIMTSRYVDNRTSLVQCQMGRFAVGSGYSTFDSFGQGSSKIVLFLSNNTFTTCEQDSGEMSRCPEVPEHILSDEVLPLLSCGGLFFSEDLI